MLFFSLVSAVETHQQLAADSPFLEYDQIPNIPSGKP